eukprot:gene9637-8602_t
MCRALGPLAAAAVAVSLPALAAAPPPCSEYDLRLTNEHVD